MFWQYLVVILLLLGMVGAGGLIVMLYIRLSERRSKTRRDAINVQQHRITAFETAESRAAELPSRRLRARERLLITGLIVLWCVCMAGVVTVTSALFGPDPDQHCAPGTTFHEVNGRGTVVVQQHGVGWWCE